MFTLIRIDDDKHQKEKNKGKLKPVFLNSFRPASHTKKKLNANVGKGIHFAPVDIL